MKKQTVPLFFLLLILLPILQTRIFPVKAPDWYTEDSLEWTYRKSIGVNNTYDDLNNWTIKFYPITAEGSDTGNSIYLGSGYQADLDDIRITNSTNGLLNHWIDWKDVDNKDISNNQTLYFCTPTLLNNTVTTFYVYWGSALAPNIENGSLALTFWDDFDEDYEIGDDPLAVYHRYWAIAGDTPTYPDNYIDIVANPYTGQDNGDASNLVVRIAETGSADYDNPYLSAQFRDWDGTLEYHFDFELRFIISWLNEDGDGRIIMYEDANNRIDNRIEWAVDDYWDVYYGASWNPLFTCNDDIWYWMVLRIYDDSDYDYDVERDLTNYDADWNTNPSNGISVIQAFQTYHANSMFLDHFFVIVHTPRWLDDPVIVTVGSEEEQEIENGLPELPYSLTLLTLDDWLGLALGIDTFVAGLLLGLIMLLSCMSPLIFASKERPIWATIIGFSVCSFNVAIGWFPVWLLVVLVLIVALLYGERITKRLGVSSG